MSQEIWMILGVIAFVTIIKVLDGVEFFFEKRNRDQELKLRLKEHAWKDAQSDVWEEPVKKVAPVPKKPVMPLKTRKR